jgi:hypothetical protein
MAEALWEGEPVADYVEKRSGSWEVVELLLHDASGRRLVAAVTAPGIPHLKADEVEASAEDGRFVSFVGVRCRLSARVIGEVRPQVKRELQSLCQDLDTLMEDTALDSAERARLVPLRLRSGLRREGPLTSAHASTRATVAMAVAATFLLAMVTWAGVMEYRWQRFVQVLRREPGIHVTAHERGWGRTRVEGIITSQSRDPKVLAGTLGLDPSAIEMDFKTTALEPAVLQAALSGSNPTLTVPSSRVAPAQEVAD